jgi:hypothetical protein
LAAPPRPVERARESERQAAPAQPEVDVVGDVFDTELASIIQEQRRRTSLLLVSLLVPATLVLAIFVVAMLVRSSEKTTRAERPEDPASDTSSMMADPSKSEPQILPTPEDEDLYPECALVREWLDTQPGNLRIVRWDRLMDCVLELPPPPGSSKPIVRTRTSIICTYRSNNDPMEITQRFIIFQDRIESVMDMNERDAKTAPRFIGSKSVDKHQTMGGNGAPERRRGNDTLRTVGGGVLPGRNLEEYAWTKLRFAKTLLKIKNKQELAKFRSGATDKGVSGHERSKAS